MDSHKILTNAFNKVELSSKNYILVNYIDKNNFVYFGYYFNNIHVLLSHLNFILKIYFNYSSYNKFIFREFSNICLIIFLPFFYFKKKHIYFNVNHNFKNKKSFLKYKILSYISFNFIFFDSTYIIEKKFNFINLKFPIYNYKPFKNINSVNFLRIGILGDLSNSYNITNLNIFLSSFKNENFRLQIGGKNINKFNSINFNKEIDLIDTKSETDYISFLDNIDILIFLADYNSYLYRHSGTIMDSISRRIILLAPNYFVFKSQLTNPIQVGHLYNNINDIISILNNQNILFLYYSNFDNYLLDRSSTQFIL
jgi:hypothetical protein